MLMVVLWDALFKSSSRHPPGRTVIKRVSCRSHRQYHDQTYVVAVQLLLLVKLRVQLVDTGPEVGRVTTEGDVEVLQEGVTASKQRLGLVGVSINTRLAVKDNDLVSEIGSHDEIVLDDEGGLLGVHDESLDDTAGNDTLFGVEIWVQYEHAGPKRAVQMWRLGKQNIGQTHKQRAHR